MNAMEILIIYIYTNLILPKPNNKSNFIYTHIGRRTWRWREIEIRDRVSQPHLYHIPL